MNRGFGALLRALTERQVRFIIIGGVAATIHGSEDNEVLAELQALLHERGDTVP
jgi:predicted nucleotidyltransferase